MTEANTDIVALRASLSTFKQEMAKVIVGMQVGGDRKRRRDLTRRLDASKRRAKALRRDVDTVLLTLHESDPARTELATAAMFLEKIQTLGEGASPE